MLTEMNELATTQWNSVKIHIGLHTRGFIAPAATTGGFHRYNGLQIGAKKFQYCFQVYL